MRTVSGDSDWSATRDSSAHPGRGPLVKASGGGCDKPVPLRPASVSTERRSSPALDVDYQLWGTEGGYSLLQSTLLVPSR